MVERRIELWSLRLEAINWNWALIKMDLIMHSRVWDGFKNHFRKLMWFASFKGKWEFYMDTRVCKWCLKLQRWILASPKERISSKQEAANSILLLHKNLLVPHFWGLLANTTELPEAGGWFPSLQEQLELPLLAPGLQAQPAGVGLAGLQVRCCGQ